MGAERGAERRTEGKPREGQKTYSADKTCSRRNYDGLLQVIAQNSFSLFFSYVVLLIRNLSIDRSLFRASSLSQQWGRGAGDTSV